jgi:hypothetical protein
MTAENLDLFISNDSKLLGSIQFAVKHLRDTVDRAAVKLAKINADWHDDPAAEDHAEFHAPAEVQFPRAVRDEVIRDFVAFYLAEMRV